MARAHFVKKARKAKKEHGIKKDDSYYWWAFRTAYSSSKYYSKTPPKPSQLIQSPYISQMVAIQERIEKLKPDEGLKDWVESICDDLENLADECQEKYDNMPEGLQQGDTGQMLEQRVENCNTAKDELEGIDFDDSNRPESQTEEEFWQARLEEVQTVDIQID